MRGHLSRDRGDTCPVQGGHLSRTSGTPVPRDKGTGHSLSIESVPVPCPRPGGVEVGTTGQPETWRLLVSSPSVLAAANRSSLFVLGQSPPPILPGQGDQACR